MILVQPEGIEVGMVFHNDFVIGRNLTCGLHLQDDYVSPFHAKVMQDEHGQWVIEDLGSTNGTWVNGVRAYRALPYGGYQVRIGRTTLTVVPG